MQTHLFMILYHPLRQCLKMGVGISVHLIFHSHLCLMQTMQISKIPVCMGSNADSSFHDFVP